MRHHTSTSHYFRLQTSFDFGLHTSHLLHASTSQFELQTSPRSDIHVRIDFLILRHVTRQTQRLARRRRRGAQTRRPREGSRTDHRRVRARLGREGTALPARRQRPRLPADEQQQLPVAVVSSRGAGRRRRGFAHVRRGSGRRPLHRRHVRAACAARSADRAFRGPAGRAVFNSAYTTVLGVAITLSGPDTFWMGDALNHNCIIRAMRIANVPSAQRAIYRHNDLADLAHHLERVPDGTGRVIVIFDGIFSMRGDNAPVDAIAALARDHESRFRDGVVTVMDDSHGIARLRTDGAWHRGALRRWRRHLHRHVREGVRGERRVRRGQRRARRGGAAESGHLHLYESAGRGRRGGGGEGDRRRGLHRGPRATRAPRGAHHAVPPRARVARVRVDRRSTPGRSAASSATPAACARWSAGLFDRGILAVGLTYPGRPQGRRDHPLPDQRGAHRGRHRRAAAAC